MARPLADHIIDMVNTVRVLGPSPLKTQVKKHHAEAQGGKKESGVRSNLTGK
jgi:hypothetical protein